MKRKPNILAMLVCAWFGALPVCLFASIGAMLGKPVCIGFVCAVRPEWLSKLLGG